MKKAVFRNNNGELEEFIIDTHPGHKDRFAILHYRQFQVCHFHMLAFRNKSFKSRTTASNYLLQRLNQRLDAGEISHLTII